MVFGCVHSQLLLPLAAVVLSGCSDSTKVTRLVSPAQEATTEPVADGPDVRLPPEPSAYSLKVKTASKQCFGSAGCNVEVKIKLAVVDPGAYDVPVDLTVEVRGDESGLITETMSLDEEGSYGVPEISMSTRSSRTKITAKVVDVERTD